ncbi:MAG: hypothetical protein HY875_09950 [Chloroflexi bacterium]|nr:hypothetical protein [Chloroflexota bacterium]
MRTWLLAFTIAAVALTGLVMPRAVYRDCSCGVTEVQRDRLKAQAANLFQIRPLQLQVTQANAPSADADAAKGVVTLRGPFGLKTGSVVMGEQETDVRHAIRGEFALWVAFAAALAAPLALLFRELGRG